MTRWLVPSFIDGQDWAFMELNLKPRNSPGALPEGEDPRWISVVDVIENGQVVGKQITVNESLKLQIQQQDLAESTVKAQAELQASKVRAKKARMSFGQTMKAEIAVLNDTKPWDQATHSAYLADAKVQTLSALLQDGALETASAYAKSQDWSEYYTAQEVTSVTDKIDAYVAGES